MLILFNEKCERKVYVDHQIKSQYERRYSLHHFSLCWLWNIKIVMISKKKFARGGLLE